MSLNILLSHRRSLKVIENDTVICKSLLISNYTCPIKQGDHLSGNLEMTGNLTVVREMVVRQSVRSSLAVTCRGIGADEARLR